MCACVCKSQAHTFAFSNCSFHLSVNGNLRLRSFYNTSLCDWLKKLGLLSQPVRNKGKINRDLQVCVFQRLAPVSYNCFKLWLATELNCSGFGFKTQPENCSIYVNIFSLVWTFHSTSRKSRLFFRYKKSQHAVNKLTFEGAVTAFVLTAFKYAVKKKQTNWT